VVQHEHVPDRRRSRGVADAERAASGDKQSGRFPGPFRITTSLGYVQVASGIRIGAGVTDIAAMTEFGGVGTSV
jgi:hypothetical protein